MKLGVLYLFILLGLYSCKNEKKVESSFLIEEVGEFLSLTKVDDISLEGSEDSAWLMSNYKVNAVEENALGDLAFVAGEIADTLILAVGAEKLFGDYHSKNFISGVSEKYNLVEALGNIYVKNIDGGFDKVSIKKFIIGNFNPKVEKVDKVYYNNKLTDKKSISAGIAFLKIEAQKNMKAEVLIKDEISVILPDENRNVDALKKLKEINKNIAIKYYFSYGATLTSITYKTYTESKWKPAINATWLTLGSKKFLGQDNLSYKSNVHVDIIPLDKMVFMPELNDMQ